MIDGNGNICTGTDLDKLIREDLVETMGGIAAPPRKSNYSTVFSPAPIDKSQAIEI